MSRFVVVGSGLAGHRAVTALRSLASEAEITLIGGEPGLPYERPPLTKEFLLGKLDPAALTVEGADRYAEQGITYHSSLMVTKIDRHQRRVFIDGTGYVGYDKLLLTTGSRPRQIEGAGHSEHVHYLRTLPDAIRLRTALQAGAHIAIVGGGFIGLEVAAAATALGCQVSLLEADNALLSRGVPLPVRCFLHALHAAQGVSVALNSHVMHVSERSNGALIHLSSGELSADAVVVGIGVIPNVELAEAAGLAVHNGIVVDRQCRTSDPDIFAAGEVTTHPVPPRGELRRVESWKVAIDQPLIAAACMTGGEGTFDEPPWLWSDQYGINFQMIGIPDAGVSYLLREDAGLSRWTLIGLTPDGRPLGAIAANNGRDISVLRPILRKGAFLPSFFTDGLAATDKPVFSQEIMQSMLCGRTIGQPAQTTAGPTGAVPESK